MAPIVMMLAAVVLSLSPAPVVEYLTEIGFGAEFGQSSHVLHRWEADVRVHAHGEPTEADLVTLNEVVQELDLLIPSLTIEITDNNPNVAIHFMPESEFALVDPQYVPVNMGYFRVWWDGQGVINRSRILIATQGVNQTERSHLIREELTQSLGLFNDSWQYQDSIFYQGWTDTTEYSALDRQVISMMYSPDLWVGMSREELRDMHD